MKPSKTLDTSNIVEFIGDIFARCGDEEYLGEPVTMAEHMLQSASLAENDDMPVEIIVGALLHDIGHFTSEFGTFSMQDTEDRYHEAAGAKVLGGFFPPVIVECAQQHVAAKRYLCATDEGYFDKLSKASVHSLELQGGPMTAQELAAFQSNPYLDAIIQVRLYDDRAKDPNRPTPTYDHFAPLVQAMVDQHTQA